MLKKISVFAFIFLLRLNANSQAINEMQNSHTVDSSKKLNSVHILKSAEVTSEKAGTMISISPYKTEILTNKELRKAACCNLGESFETNATVDVTYKDALSGSKELQLLGLSGSYIQLLTENAPLIAGLGLTYGLNTVPGSQIESISIVKGPGSVVFGPESLSGSINLELKNPSKEVPLFINYYLDENFRNEINIDLARKVNSKLATLLSIHTDVFNKKIDENGDDFLDIPLVKNFNVLNKWKFENGKGLVSQNTIRFMNEERMAGQKQFDYSKDIADLSAWGQKLNTNRVEFYGRTGKVIPSAVFQSIGFQYSIVSHDQKGFAGIKSYVANQLSANFRIIYNREIGTQHSLNAGFSLKSEKTKEQFALANYDRSENVFGVFIEDTYKPDARSTFVLGFRADRFSDKIYFIPRANYKFSINENTDLRASVGVGVRNPHFLAENPAILMSTRKYILKSTLLPESALNYGINLTHNFLWNYRKGAINFDWYQTDFKNRMRIDYDTDPMTFLVYNQTNASTSKTFQVELMYKILKTVEWKIAYKYLDVITYTDSIGKLSDPFIAKNRIVSSLYYESFNRKWKANFTLNLVGSKRLPAIHLHDSTSKPFLQSPAYQTINLQLTRTFKNTEVYIGAENMLDFKQLSHLTGSDDPYGPYFDVSNIWGPMDGRRIYLGFRFKLSENKKYKR
jgi:outer membrane receptor for ferrienterochelin and colicins